MRGLALLVLVTVGCLETMPKPYCSRMPTGEAKCFATEAERLAEYETRNPKPAPPPRSTAVHPLVAAELERQEAEKKEREARDAEYEARRAADLAAREERAARKRRAADRVSDKVYAVPVVSALLCEREEALVELRDAMRREERVTAIGGVRDLRERRELAEGVELNTQETAALKRVLQKMGAARLACGAVERLRACRADEKTCDTETRDVADVWRAGYATYLE